MRDNVIYHNPRCSKSRGALKLLQDRDVEVEVVEYLRTPPSAKELGEICRLLGVAPTEITRTREARFKELGLSAEDARPDAEWLRLLAKNPVLIERPIVVVNGRAVVGRPPEKVLRII